MIANNEFLKNKHDVHYKDRHIGLSYTAFGWFLIALSSVFFAQTRASHNLVNTCFHHYLIAFMVISLWAGLKKRRHFFCKNPLLILINSLVCMACYYIYFMMRAAPASISNSYLLNADALILAGFSIFFLKRRIHFLSWGGLLIGFAGIMCFFSFETDFVTFKGFSDALMCLVSASALVCVILLTQYLLTNNPPVIIALSHCLVGLFCSGIFLTFSGWQLPTNFDLFCMIIDGLMYGVSLYFFINALQFAEAYIIMSLSYLVPVYLLFINVGMRRSWLDLNSFVGILLVLGGVVLVPIPAFLRDRKKKWEVKTQEPKMVDEYNHRRVL